jgi:hypothetical protein
MCIKGDGRVRIGPGRLWMETQASEGRGEGASPEFIVTIGELRQLVGLVIDSDWS